MQNPTNERHTSSSQVFAGAHFANGPRGGSMGRPVELFAYMKPIVATRSRTDLPWGADMPEAGRAKRCGSIARLHATEGLEFNSGTLGDLRAWARSVGLLRGQRNRGIERALSELRNLVAHPNGHHLTGPVHAARTLGDLAEIINQLWGVPTPGGRLYPAPLHREVIVMAWPTGAEEIQTAIAGEAFVDFVDPDDRAWECVILRAVSDGHQRFRDLDLDYWDSRVEVTHYPVDLLWGPGTITDAAAWHAQHKPQPDHCDYLDRPFLIRHAGADLHLPMRPTVAAALPNPERTGTWYTVRADYPDDAYRHVYNLITGVGCDRSGPCRRCHAESLGTGPHPVALSYAGYSATTVSTLPNDVGTPLARPRAPRVPKLERRTNATPSATALKHVDGSM